MKNYHYLLLLFGVCFSSLKASLPPGAALPPGA